MPQTLPQFLKASAPALKGPLAVILAEDVAEIVSTLDHHLDRGFRSILILSADGMAGAEHGPKVHAIAHDTGAPDALPDALNLIIPAIPGQWIYAGYNAEYLFHPFAETRSIGELTTFHAEERREAMLTTVIDLYAADLTRFPDGVSVETAHLDSAGYYALPRKDAAAGYAAVERQSDIFGGLRWRYEEHVPWDRRRIDRIGLFRAKPGLTMRPDFTLSDQEMNTHACEWHHNLTAAVCSFRTAKALRANPDSRHAIPGFLWRASRPFGWTSQELMDMGLMEPGQWF